MNWLPSSWFTKAPADFFEKGALLDRVELSRFRLDEEVEEEPVLLLFLFREVLLELDGERFSLLEDLFLSVFFLELRFWSLISF